MAASVVFLAGVMASAAAFFTAWSWDHAQMKSHFTQAAHDRISTLKANFREDLTVAQAIESFYAGSEDVNRKEFRRFIEPFMDWQEDILAVEWAPRVRLEERTALEDKVRREGFNGFLIRDASDKFPPAADRSEYFPILYIEPFVKNKDLLGIDLKDIPSRFGAMRLACDTGKIALTPKVRLFRSSGEVDGFIITAPVYQGGECPATAEQRRAALKGFVLAAFPLQDFVEEGINLFTPTGIDVHLFDITDKTSQHLYTHWSRTKNAADRPPPTLAEMTMGLSEASHLDMGGRKWMVYCKPAPVMLATARTWHPWLALAVGLLLTTLATAYLLLARKSRMRLEHLLAELYDGKQALETEMAFRRKAEEAQGREYARLSAMLAGMEEGVVFADADGVLVEVNDYFCRFVGKTRQEILGHRIEELHTGKVLQSMQTAIAHFRDNPGSPALSIQRTLGAIEAILRIQPIYRDKKYDGVLLTITDVTELVSISRQAQTASQTKSAFLANMSHEIRTPMTAILGYSDLLSDPALSASDRDNFLGVIRRNGEHLLTLINDVLDLSKIEAGKFTIEKTRCSLPGIIADVASLMRPRTAERGNTLSVEYRSPLPETICTDSMRVRQALLNLVSNATKFTADGTIRIITTFLPETSRVQIDVSDTGIGIEPDRIGELFQPFVQADASTSRKFGGTGLGLTITRQIARILGGEITVHSEVGKGSLFSLTIPAGDIEGVPLLNNPFEAVQSEREAQSHAAPPRSLRGVRLLLAEDGIDNQRLLRAILKGAGADVALADNGKIAVEKALAEPFDAILMDMQMPEMDGYEATRLLREKGLSLPILALTAHAMSGDRQKCVAAGCNDYLTKPIQRDKLIESIVEWCHPQPPADPGADEGENICSEFANDPELSQVLAEFVSELPNRMLAMQAMLQANQLESLQRQAHQLKGAGGSYGYPQLTELARELEAAAKGKDVETAGMKLAKLTAMCKAICNGHPRQTGCKEHSA